MSVIKRLSFLALSAVLLLCASCSDKAGQETDSLAAEDLIDTKTTTYKTQEAVYKDLIKTASTTVEPVYAESRSVNSGGGKLIFKSFAVRRGDVFSKGDVLAVMIGTGNQSDVRQISLELEYARATFEENCKMMEDGIEITKAMPAEDEYAQRIKELNIEKQQAALELYKLNTRANLDSMQARMDEAEAALEEKYVYAPYDGRVQSLANLKEGDELDPYTNLMSINSLESMLLYTNSSIGSFIYNMNVDITYKKSDREYTVSGRVVSSPELLPPYLSSGIYIKLDSVPEVMPSTNVKASINYIILKNALTVPRTGVTAEGGDYYVMLLDGNTTQKRYIVRGPKVGDEIVVLQGVQAGDLVITNQYTS
jgi:membrane fusion protein (multidrug efflux system)